MAHVLLEIAFQIASLLGSALSRQLFLAILKTLWIFQLLQIKRPVVLLHINVVHIPFDYPVQAVPLH